jgi:glutathione peroxidase
MVNAMARVTHLCWFLASLFTFPQLFSQQAEKTPVTTTSIYDFVMKTIDGKEKSLADYKGKVLLVVNVASFCGYTPQYEDLEEVYRKYRDRGFRILAFPANNFGEQEPRSDEEIKTFCSTKYDVTFDLFSKISVRGDDQHPLYKYITKESPFPGDVKWNFQKYLVDANGTIVAMYPSKTKPTDGIVVERIESLLKK